MRWVSMGFDPDGLVGFPTDADGLAAGERDFFGEEERSAGSRACLEASTRIQDSVRYIVP